MIKMSTLIFDRIFIHSIKQDGLQRPFKPVVGKFSKINVSETSGGNVLKLRRIHDPKAFYKRLIFCVA